MDEMLTVEEVAEILKVKPLTVRQMFRERRLRAFKIGKAWRTTRTWLEEDLAAMSQGETGPPSQTEAEPSGERPVHQPGKGRRSPVSQAPREVSLDSGQPPAATETAETPPANEPSVDPCSDYQGLPPETCSSPVIPANQADGKPLSGDKESAVEKEPSRREDPQQYLF